MKRKTIHCILLLVLCAALVYTGITCAVAENSNLVSSGGMIAVQDDVVYFIGQDYTGGRLNDGRETGLPDSVEFWRIADVPGAQKELAVSLPAPQVDGGVILTGGCNMIPVGDSIYYLREKPMNQNCPMMLSRLDPLSGTVEDIAPVSMLARDREMLYILTNGRIFRESSQWMTLDLRTGEFAPFEPETGSNPSGSIRRLRSPGYRVLNDEKCLLDIQDGVAYYTEAWPGWEGMSIYRAPVGGGEAEEFIHDVSPWSGTELAFIQDNMLFLAQRDMVACFDIATKTLVDTIESDRLVWGDESLCRFNISDGKIYFLKDDGLYVKTLGVDDETQIMTGNTEDLIGLTLGSQYFYMIRMPALITGVCRVPVTAKSMDEAETLLTNHDQITAQEENGWVFYEYENCINLSDYTGDEIYATVPAQIHGKPVVYFSLNSENRSRPLRELVVPEGVLRLGSLYSDNLTGISLPTSLILMSDWGYPNIFHTADNCTVRYAGTCEEWQALDDASWSMEGSYTGSCAQNVLVLCADGLWTEPSE